MNLPTRRSVGNDRLDDVYVDFFHDDGLRILDKKILGRHTAVLVSDSPPSCAPPIPRVPLSHQVADLVKAFDDRVKEMCDLRVQVQMFIASQV